MVLFDAPGCKWKRAVLVGRMMILPDGELPTSLAIPKEATNGVWKMGHMKRTAGDTDFENGVYYVLYGGSTVDNASIYMADGLIANRDARGVWHRYVLYFDADAAVVVFAVWPEDRAAPSAAEWELRQKETLAPTFSGKEVGVGLLTQGVPAMWQGLKLVPLGPDMPLPPERVGKRNGKDRPGVGSVE